MNKALTRRCKMYQTKWMRQKRQSFFFLSVSLALSVSLNLSALSKGYPILQMVTIYSFPSKLLKSKFNPNAVSQCSKPCIPMPMCPHQLNVTWDVLAPASWSNLEFGSWQWYMCCCCTLSGMTLMQTAELQHHSCLNFTSWSLVSAFFCRLRLEMNVLFVLLLCWTLMMWQTKNGLRWNILD